MAAACAQAYDPTSVDRCGSRYRNFSKVISGIYRAAAASQLENFRAPPGRKLSPSVSHTLTFTSTADTACGSVDLA